MKIYFNALGALTSRDTTDEAIRQGNVGNTITAYFAGKNNQNYVAKITFTRPDGTHLDNVVMTPSQTEENAFIFVLNDEWYLAIHGEASLTIFLYDANSNIIASGQVQLPIERSDYFDNPETVTYAQYNALLELIATKLNIANGISVHASREAINPVLYGEGQIFFTKDNTRFYIKDEGILREYDIFNPENEFVSTEENEYVIPPEDR